MTDQRLHCSKRLHALALDEGSILEIHCRYHSYKEPGLVVKVYHRWYLQERKWNPLPDRREVTEKDHKYG